jgi:glycosyltransferase involved in cell wall biosynthesis
MWVGVAARLAFRTRVIYDSHELWADRNGRKEPRAWLIAMEALFVRVANRCITTSPGHAAAIARRYRIAVPTVVRNVPAAIRSPSREPPEGAPTAVYVGGVMPQRGLEQLIAALPLVSGLQLRIIGPGRADYLEALVELARGHGVGDRVSFSAPVPPERVVEVARNSHVGVALYQPSCRSYRLGLPNKLSEYTLAGVPVVASDLPIHAAFVREHDCGELVDPTDSVEIANALRRVLLPERQRELRGNLARQPIRLNWARERAVLEGVYREAAGDPEDDG